MSLTFELNIQHTYSPIFALDLQMTSTALSVGLTGPSGSGKSSILHAVAGLMEPDCMRAAVLGRRLDGLSPASRRVGIVLQAPHLFPHLDVNQNLTFGARRARGRLDPTEIISLLEIDHLLTRRVRHLSGGEQQRVALGRALLSEPDLLLLDEPFVALDPERRDRITARLKMLFERHQLPLLLVSHDATMLQDLCHETHHLLEGSRAQ